MPNHHEHRSTEEPSVGVFCIEGSLRPEERRKISGSDLFYATTESLTDTKLAVWILEYSVITKDYSPWIIPIECHRT